MTIQQRDAFTARCLLVLKTAETDGNRKTIRVVIDTLAKAHAIPASYPAR